MIPVFLVCLKIDLDPDFTGTIDLLAKLMPSNMRSVAKKTT
jgi:hypothetical protein